MLDNTIFIGVNAPKAHQRIIGLLMTGLGSLYYKMQTIAYEPFVETMIDEGKTSPTPDVLLYDHANKRNVVIIEISTNTGTKKDFEKVIELVNDYEVNEGFVYNYDKNTWLKYQLGVGEIKENPSFCAAIGYDLKEFLS